MAQNGEAAGFTRTTPEGNLSRSVCDRCGCVFISKPDVIHALEAAHRKTCRVPKAAAGTT